MNKRFFAAWLVVFIVWFLGDFVVHGLLLHADYARLPALFRPDSEAQQYFPFMLLAHVIMSGALVWIYARGAEAGKPWTAQGVRFGIAMALVTTVPVYMIYYVVQPLPGDLATRQIVYATVLMVVVGMVVAFMYRDRAAAAAVGA